VAGADRIGHGIDLAHERTRRPSCSDARRRHPGRDQPDLERVHQRREGENHPVTLYRKYGVPYVISTDDAGVTRHTLSQEYVLFASRYKPDYAELKKPRTTASATPSCRPPTRRA
jgi:adenosine deaminase